MPCVYVYSRDRYALIVTPLLVLAQRKLLERISSFGGPAVPQPHHAKTQRATGKEVAHTFTHKHVQAVSSQSVCVHTVCGAVFSIFQVTYKSYAGCQLFSGWTPHTALQPLSRKKAPLTNLTPRDAVELKGLSTKLQLFQITNNIRMVENTS